MDIAVANKRLPVANHSQTAHRSATTHSSVEHGWLPAKGIHKVELDAIE
jgi:hypothetical protein